MAETVKQDIDWGGSAFPCEGGSDSNLYPDPGMSMRDYFAGQALAGMLANPERVGSEAKFSGWAAQAYFFADAMIAARKGGAS